jgi:hypothetical protein
MLISGIDTGVAVAADDFERVLATAAPVPAITAAAAAAGWFLANDTAVFEMLLIAVPARLAPFFTALDAVVETFFTALPTRLAPLRTAEEAVRDMELTALLTALAAPETAPVTAPTIPLKRDIFNAS